MDVAILFSGGKDSVSAVDFCLNKNYNIKYLLSVKPTRTDCYLFHFATVEFTKELAKILNIKHIYTTCDVSNPKKEAEIVKNMVEKNMVDALVLGGTGLQETQIKSIRDALFPLGVEVFASHMNQDHASLLKDMIERGYEIILTQFAVEGLDKTWLGRKIDKKAFTELKKISNKYGFHLPGEGGHWESLVTDAPFFEKKLEIVDSEKITESKYSGYLRIKKMNIIDKSQRIRLSRSF